MSEVDIVTFAEKITTLTDNQRRFIKKQSGRKKTFETWPIGSDIQKVSNILILYDLVTKVENVAYISTTNAKGWSNIKSIVDHFLHLVPEARAERHNRNVWDIHHETGDTTHIHFFTYVALSRGGFRGKPSFDHIHMDQYKSVSDKVKSEMRHEWKTVIQHKGERITGLSSK